MSAKYSNDSNITMSEINNDDTYDYISTYHNSNADCHINDMRTILIIIKQ